MAECPGIDEIKDAVVTVLQNDMDTVVSAVNTDRGVTGGDQISSPDTSHYYTDNRTSRKT